MNCRFQSRSERGIALVITLVMLAVVTVMAIVFLGVSRRERASIPEQIQGDRVGAAARALLRRAERTPGAGPRVLQAAPAVIARIENNPGWLETLARRVGAAIALQAEAGLAISAGHVHSRQS